MTRDMSSMLKKNKCKQKKNKEDDLCRKFYKYQMCGDCTKKQRYGEEFGCSRYEVVNSDGRGMMTIQGSNPHSTQIFIQFCSNVPRKYCKIAKEFQNLSLIWLKYFNNLALSAQNMKYAIFSKYCQK